MVSFKVERKAVLDLGNWEHRATERDMEMESCVQGSFYIPSGETTDLSASPVALFLNASDC